MTVIDYILLTNLALVVLLAYVFVRGLRQLQHVLKESDEILDKMIEEQQQALNKDQQIVEITELLKKMNETKKNKRGKR